MKSEAIAASVIAGDDGRLLGWSEAASGLTDLEHEGTQRACRESEDVDSGQPRW